MTAPDIDRFFCASLTLTYIYKAKGLLHDSTSSTCMHMILTFDPNSNIYILHLTILINVQTLWRRACICIRIYVRVRILKKKN